MISKEFALHLSIFYKPIMPRVARQLYFSAQPFLVFGTVTLLAAAFAGTRLHSI